MDASPGLLISGSWDRYVYYMSVTRLRLTPMYPFRTAKVWKNFQELYELKGHEQSVWAVLIIDEANEMFLTG